MPTFKFLFVILLIKISLIAAKFQRKTNGDNIFDVINFGAIGDGQKDDTEAFMHAWEAACNSLASSPNFVVPAGKTFLLQPLVFNGECNYTKMFTFQIDGNIIAPSNPFEWICKDKKCEQWITFEHFNDLFIHGSGTINGRGQKWWELSCKHHKQLCKHKPTGFVIAHSSKVFIIGLTFEDSPKMHIAFERSTLITASHLKIKAPEDSPNTDGIHTLHSTNVTIFRSIIQTGDDCISMGDGSKHINIHHIDCGPGHGISIGSLGKQGETEEVEFVNVRDVSFNRTTNGVRIKTWQGGHGFARNIRYENIRSFGATRPIIIDQYYCPHKKCDNQTSGVEISNVIYHRIYGTSSNKETAIELSCSETTACKNIIMTDINLRNEEEDEETLSYCLNVEGHRNKRVYPSVSCLLQDDEI